MMTDSPIPLINAYPGELELKLEHSGKQATFLDQDIKIEDGIFVYI